MTTASKNNATRDDDAPEKPNRERIADALVFVQEIHRTLMDGSALTLEGSESFVRLVKMSDEETLTNLHALHDLVDILHGAV
jgi:hypothetical protein